MQRLGENFFDQCPLNSLQKYWARVDVQEGFVESLRFKPIFGQ